MINYLDNTGNKIVLSSSSVEGFLSGTEARETLVNRYIDEAENAIEYMLTIEKVAEFSMENVLAVDVGKSD